MKKIKLMGLMQCANPWSSDKGSAKAASTSQPTASETLVSEEHFQILNGKTYFEGLYLQSIYIVFSGFIFSQ